MGLILGIESSCDDSSLCLFDPLQGVLGHWVHRQLDIHSKHGGVVPDLGSREHLKHFGPLLEMLWREHPSPLIKHIAVTQGPGLASCLALGVSLASSLALALDTSLVGVNHLRGHLYSPFISLHRQHPTYFEKNLDGLLPHLGLIVSGGNTLLAKIDTSKNIHILGQTMDDAAGEALDKGAKLMGMPYPGGPYIEEKALTGSPLLYNFPRALKQPRDLRFSFSGLKTSLRYTLEKIPDAAFKARLNDLCASYQEAVIDQLVYKTKEALHADDYQSFGLSGGVANNKALQKQLHKACSSRGVDCLIAQPAYCADNAAMIAFAAYVDAKGCTPARYKGLKVFPSMTLAT